MKAALHSTQEVFVHKMLCLRLAIMVMYVAMHMDRFCCVELTCASSQAQASMHITG
jgi:hypothetical protein